MGLRLKLARRRASPFVLGSARSRRSVTVSSPPFAGAGREARQLPRDRLMQQRDPHLDAEDLGLELEGFLRLSGLIENGNLGHAYSAFRCRCWAFVSLTLFRPTTRLPMGPGPAPRTTKRFCSGNTRMTRTFSTVR